MQPSPWGQRKTQDGEMEEEEVEKEGEKVHVSPESRGEVRGRVMQKENIDRVFSLNIDSSCIKGQNGEGRG